MISATYRAILTFKFTWYILGIMKYEWDDEKNEINFEKHGVWFEEVISVWIDEAAEDYYDEDHSNKEDRWIRLGSNIARKILVVVFCDVDFETRRIISAREATSEETNDYINLLKTRWET